MAAPAENLPVVVEPRAPFWAAWLGRLMRPWLRIRNDPADPSTLMQPGAPVYYMLERYGLSNALILEEACRLAGLPAPLRPAPGGHLSRSRKVLALSRSPSITWPGFALADQRHRL